MAEPTDTPGPAAAGGNVDDLMREATALDQGAAPGAPPDPNAPGAALVALPEHLVLSNCEVIVNAVMLGRDGFTEATRLQTLALMLDDTTIGRHALMWAKVLAKRGIDLQKLQGKNGDLWTAILVTGGLAWTIYQAASMEHAQRMRTVDNTAGQAQGGDQVTGGDLVRPAGGVTDQGGPELASIGSLS